MTLPTVQLAMTELVPLAKELDENKVTPGVLGFIVFAVMGAAVWLLMKNMNRQFTKIDFEESAAVAADERAAGRPEAEAVDRPAAKPKG